MSHDDENEQTIRDSKRHEQFKKDNPDLIVSIMAIGDGETPNANHTIYPKEVVEKAVKDLQNKVKEKTLLVFDNMDGESDRNDLMRAGALITEVEVKDGKVNAKLKIIDTVCGERISTYLKNDMARLRTQLSMDDKVVGVYVEDINRIPFPK
jgi:hypothetical protein